VYYINQDGLNAIRSGKINLLQIYFFALPVVGLVNFLRYWVHSNDPTASVFFLSVGLPLMTSLFIFFLYLAWRLMKRLNNTIEEIGFENNTVIITTFSILWMKSRECTIPFSDVLVRKAMFEWFEKKKDKKGSIIRSKNEKNELYLVEDYFDDHQAIEARLQGAGIF